MLRVLLAALALIHPVHAAHVAAWAHGRSDIAPALIQICDRESPGNACGYVGLHARDARRAPHGGWGAQVRMGHLRAWCQPYRPETWSTRGPWGLWASAHWRYLPPCYQAAWLDVPIVSAWVAAAKYLERCDQPFTCSPTRWCPRRPRW